MSKNKLGELDLKKTSKAKALDILRRELGEELGYLVYAGSRTKVANFAVAKFVYDQLVSRDRWWKGRELAKSYQKSKVHNIKSEDVLKLAMFMHEEYENAARLYGWATQEKTRVPFESLPLANAKTMLHVAYQMIKYFIVEDLTEHTEQDL